MDPKSALVVSAAVEGVIDEAVLHRLAAHIGFSIGRVFGRRGKPSVLRQLSSYNNAAQHAPWVVLLDLDNDAECAPAFRLQHLAHPSRHMCFRIAVREVEAWLLADRVNLAQFLHVSPSRLPDDPDEAVDPKRLIATLAQRSRSRLIKEDISPATGGGRTVGPGYTARITDFIANSWDPAIAAKASPSLARCLTALQTFDWPIGGAVE